jgi:hypothetical protein
MVESRPDITLKKALRTAANVGRRDSPFSLFEPKFSP